MLGAVEAAGAQVGVVEDGAGDQPGHRGVEAGRGDEEVVAGAEDLDAAAGVGQHGQAGVEPLPRRQAALGRVAVDGRPQLAHDRALAGPAVDEDDPAGAVPGVQVVERDRVDAPAPHDAHGVVRQVEAVAQGRPAAQQDADRGARPGQRGEHEVLAALGEQQLGDHAGGAGDPRGRGLQRPVEQPLVARVGLVLHRQRLRVVGGAGLDGRLAGGGRGLERDVRQVLEQPAHVLGGVGAERRAAQHGPRRLPGGHRRVGGQAHEDVGTPVPASRSSSPPGARRAAVSPAASVTSTSAARRRAVTAGDVVGPAGAGVGEVVVVAREGRRRPDRVAGVGHRDDRGAGGRGEAHGGSGRPRRRQRVQQVRGHAGRGGHELLVAEHEDGAGPSVASGRLEPVGGDPGQGLRDGRGDPAGGGVERLGGGGAEAVPGGLAHAGRPAGGAEVEHGRRPGGSGPGRGGGLDVVRGHEPGGPPGGVVGQPDAAARQAGHVDADARARRRAPASRRRPRRRGRRRARPRRSGRAGAARAGRGRCCARCARSTARRRPGPAGRRRAGRRRPGRAAAGARWRGSAPRRSRPRRRRRGPGGGSSAGAPRPAPRRPRATAPSRSPRSRAPRPGGRRALAGRACRDQRVDGGGEPRDGLVLLGRAGVRAQRRDEQLAGARERTRLRARGARPRTALAGARRRRAGRRPTSPSRRAAERTSRGSVGTCLPSTVETSRWGRRGLRRSASPVSRRTSGTRPAGHGLDPDARARRRPTPRSSRPAREARPHRPGRAEPSGAGPPGAATAVTARTRPAGRRRTRRRGTRRRRAPAAGSRPPTSGAGRTRSSCCGSPRR